MSYETIARRYARAIFEIGKETGSLAQLAKDFSAFAAIYQGSDELRLVLDNPLVLASDQEAIISEIASKLAASDTTKRTLLLLSQKRRLPALPDIARQVARLADEDANILRAEVTSAGPLSSSYLAKLTTELEKATGKKVVVAHKEDKSLLGGVVTRLGDQVIDGSVKTRLAQFREQLLRA